MGKGYPKSYLGSRLQSRLKLFRIRTYKNNGEGWVASDEPTPCGGRLPTVRRLESNSCASEKNNCPRMILLCKRENNCPGMILLHKKVGGRGGGEILRPL